MTSFQIFHPWNLEHRTFDVKGTSTPSQNITEQHQPPAENTVIVCANGPGTCNPIQDIHPPVFQNEDGQQLNSLHQLRSFKYWRQFNNLLEI